MSDVYRNGPVELRFGRWQDVLQDVTADALITDPPYSQRTEDGFRTGNDLSRRGLGYSPIDAAYAAGFVESWHARITSWMVICGDHISASWFAESLSGAGRYTFPPVPIVKTGAAPRMSCDGPASQAEYLTVARPRHKRFLSWGSLPGWYAMHTVRAGHGHVGVSGAKSVDTMRAIIRDYTRPGNLIVDAHVGGGTTLLAAALEGRRAIGAECMREHYDIAVKRLSRGFTPSLFAESAGRIEMEQTGLFKGGNDE